MIRCCYCNREIKPPLNRTTEHIIPQSKGGRRYAYNVRDCCQVCNNWRANKEYGVWIKEIMRLIQLKRPYKGIEVKTMCIMVLNLVDLSLNVVDNLKYIFCVQPETYAIKIQGVKVVGKIQL